MGNDLDKLSNYFLQVADILDKIDAVLVDINASEFKEKGLELVNTSGQFSKELHELIMRYDPSFNEYEVECRIMPYLFPELKECVCEHQGEDDSHVLVNR
jgi:hypothetical protein